MLKEAGFDVTSASDKSIISQDDLISTLKNYNVLLCSGPDKLDKHFLNSCSHLDMISQFAAGYDNIDVDEATRLGLPIGYTPGAMRNATADIAFGLMIATSRKMFFMHKKIINDQWPEFRPTDNLGMELKNKTLGILGLGRIGMEMAKRCKGAYGMDILYRNRQPNAEADATLNAQLVDFNTLLEKSDVLSVHCALTDETRGVFNKDAFAQMKSSAIFINTSRGSVHNEPDLIEALNSGQIWGAGMDVTNPEPMRPDNPLLSMPNVCVLPHTGSATVEARDEMGRLAAQNIIQFYTNNTIPNIINPEVLTNR